MTLTFDLYENHNFTIKNGFLHQNYLFSTKIMGKNCDLDLQFVCFVYYYFHFNIVVHCHGDFNFIPSENVKNMKIIIVHIIHYRGHNCALLTSKSVGNPY